MPTYRVFKAARLWPASAASQRIRAEAGRSAWQPEAQSGGEKRIRRATAAAKGWAALFSTQVPTESLHGIIRCMSST